jgi:biotin carboxyl carrier protein
MKLIPSVRLDAGLPPLVTPTSQIVGAQAVNCALDIKRGKPAYTNVSNQFVSLVKGEYGKTPVPVDPGFRLKIAKVEKETPYDTSKHQLQENPALTELGGVKLAENEKETLLLELFPSVAKTFLTKQKEARYQASCQAKTKQDGAETKAETPVTGKVIVSPMPGNVFKILVQPGDTITEGQEVVILESMKMENSIVSEYTGTIKRVLTKTGANVPTGGRLLEIEV